MLGWLKQTVPFPQIMPALTATVRTIKLICLISLNWVTLRFVDQFDEIQPMLHDFKCEDFGKCYLCLLHALICRKFLIGQATWLTFGKRIRHRKCVLLEYLDPIQYSSIEFEPDKQFVPMITFQLSSPQKLLSFNLSYSTVVILIAIEIVLSKCENKCIDTCSNNQLFDLEYANSGFLLDRDSNKLLVFLNRLNESAATCRMLFVAPKCCYRTGLAEDRTPFLKPRIGSKWIKFCTWAVASLVG